MATEEKIKEFVKVTEEHFDRNIYDILHDAIDMKYCRRDMLIIAKIYLVIVEGAMIDEEKFLEDSGGIEIGEHIEFLRRLVAEVEGKGHIPYNGVNPVESGIDKNT